MRGTMSRAVDAHLRYLERDGVTRDGDRGKAYSAFENEADGNAFVERGREDRHQFRFIVAPEDATEMADLRGFTRDLMRQMELDLATRLDWIAVDHHNTGHPHTHIIVRGVLDDGRILNIAGDYIAHGVRHRASELATRELGHQTEIELQTKLQNEVEAERVTRLDKLLLSEQQEQGVIDLRPGEGATFLVRENRNLMIGRVRHLERYGLATELEPGRWTLSDRAEQVLKDLDHRNEAINSIHRALTRNGLAEERGVGQFALHSEISGEKIVGRVLAKGLAGDEMGERVYLVVDSIDGRVHHIEFKDPSRIEEVGRDMIVEAAPVVSGPRPADRNIASNVEDDNGIYRPSRHLERIRDSFERQGKDPEAYRALPCPPPGGAAAGRPCRADRCRSLEGPEGHRRAWAGLRPQPGRRRLKNTDALGHRPRPADRQRWCDLARPTDYCRGPLGNQGQRVWQRGQQSYQPPGSATCRDGPCDRQG